MSTRYASDSFVDIILLRLNTQLKRGNVQTLAARCEWVCACGKVVFRTQYTSFGDKFVDGDEVRFELEFRGLTSLESVVARSRVSLMGHSWMRYTNRLITVFVINNHEHIYAVPHLAPLFGGKHTHDKV